MRLRDCLLATLASLDWGFGFVVIKLGLQSFSAPQLTALRFVVAALPVFVVARPRIAWQRLALIGLTLFTGQFLLLFFAIAAGLPAGLASVTQQTQVFFTVLLAALFLRERPGVRQCLGMAAAFLGVVSIGATVGSDLPPLALALAFAGAFSWAVGNVLVKSAAEVPVLSLVVWASLVPPLPSLLVSGLSGGQGPGLAAALAHASWLGIGCVVYLGAFATTLAYALWGDLLQRYAAARVAPFALLAPCAGIVSSALVFGEVFGPIRCVGMALVLLGLAVIVLPARGLSRAGR